MPLSDEFVEATLHRLMETDASNDVFDAVLAACQGDEAFGQWRNGASPQRPAATSSTDSPTARAAYLTSLSVEGFRGIGAASTLSFAARPGLHVVIGRNGCGKSSFAEALEVLMTGANRRLESRSKGWTDGWRNLHHGASRVEATFQVEGTSAVTTLRRAWPGDAKAFGDAPTTAQEHGKARADLASMGWDRAVAAYRPLLSAADFEGIAGKPSELYELLAGVLGLQEFVDATARFDAEAKRLKGVVDSPKSSLPSLLTKLRTSGDDRAAQCVTALDTGRKPQDLAAVEAIAFGDVAPDSAVATLQARVSLPLPSMADAEAAASALRDAAAALDTFQDEALQHAIALARVLDEAMRFHDETADQPCPVCGAGHLDAAWHERARQQRDELQQHTGEITAAQQQLATARHEALALITPVPVSLQSDEANDTTVAMARAAWQAFAAPLRAEPALSPHSLADHLEHHAIALPDAVASVIADAHEQLGRLDAEWRPLAKELAAWATTARAAIEAQPRLEVLTKAKKWLTDEADRLRRARFAPLADEAQIIWEQLRYRSNVSLCEITLGGTGTRRHVDFALQVDDADASVGVLSQGEINALALSLFIPRATRAQSPFRFLVIDDPVQSMDPAKVDGLARVLDGLAQDRQVIVLTHDDRLPHALRRLGLPARVVELSRGTHSAVKPVEVTSPATNAVKSARAIAADKTIGDELEQRIIPGFCRMALEATFNDLAWRKLLTSGRSHDEVDIVLADATTLYQRAAIAFYGDVGETGKVLARLNQLGHRFGDAFLDCNKGAHEPIPHARALLDDVEMMIERLAPAGAA